MISTPDYNDPAPDQSQDDAAAYTGDDIEPEAEGDTETSPEQPPAGETISHNSDDSTKDENETRNEMECPSVQDEINAQPDAAAADEADSSAKPPFLVELHDPHRTAMSAATLLTGQGVFRRGGKPVTLWGDEQHGLVVAKTLTADDVTSLIHGAAQPFVLRKTRSGTRQEDVAFPVRVANLVLSSFVGATLLPLNGIAYGPLIAPDGTILHINGYDGGSGLFFHNAVDMTIPNRATRNDAAAALRRLRKRLRSFPFADSIRVMVNDSKEPVVDIDQPPGADESICLTALLTAVCRPSLPLVPGLLVTAPYLSGAGSGKGMLVRFIAEVAYGLSPTAMTTGHNVDEFDKRLASVLMTAAPIILLDNVNATELRSNLLASAITENPAQVRVLRTSTLVPLNSSTFICVTGNGLSVTEDLRRRFLEVQLNPGVENPEARSFAGDFLAETRRDRSEILSDVLTIVAWGLQQGNDLPSGRSLGSFEQWGRMCRDPLLALACKDAVKEIAERQPADSERIWLAEFLDTWWQHHGNRQVTGKDLHGAVWDLLAPSGENRQQVTQKLMQLNGATCNGFRLQQIKMAGKWSPHRYRLERTNAAPDDQGHRPGGGDNGQHETGNGLDGLGGPTRPPLKRRM